MAIGTGRFYQLCDEILIPAGTFLKGVTDSQEDVLIFRDHGTVFPNMKPQREIYVDAFRIDLFRSGRGGQYAGSKSTH